MVVFLHRTEPDLEFEGLLKRRHTQIKYLSVTLGSPFLILEMTCAWTMNIEYCQGSLMNPGDLERAKVITPLAFSRPLICLSSSFHEHFSSKRPTRVYFWPTNTARTRMQKMLPTLCGFPHPRPQRSPSLLCCHKNHNQTQVISIKNYAHDLRVIIQLMQYHNKVFII